jgi:hypothetical protein
MEMLLTRRKTRERMQALPPVRFEICTYESSFGAFSLQNEFHIFSTIWSL